MNLIHLLYFVSSIIFFILKILIICLSIVLHTVQRELYRFDPYILKVYSLSEKYPCRQAFLRFTRIRQKPLKLHHGWTSKCV